jgi:hypothetical protein
LTSKASAGLTARRESILEGKLHGGSGARDREKFPRKKSPNFQLYFVLGFSHKKLSRDRCRVKLKESIAEASTAFVFLVSTAACNIQTFEKLCTVLFLK